MNCSVAVGKDSETENSADFVAKTESEVYNHPNGTFVELEAADAPALMS